MPQSTLAASSFPSNLAQFDYVIPPGPVTLHLGAVVEGDASNPFNVRVVKDGCLGSAAYVSSELYSAASRESAVGASAAIDVPRAGAHVAFDQAARETYTDVVSRFYELALARDPGQRTSDCAKAIEEWFRQPASTSRELHLVTEVVSAHVVAAATSSAVAEAHASVPYVGVEGQGESTTGTGIERDAAVVAWRWELLASGGAPRTDTGVAAPSAASLAPQASDLQVGPAPEDGPHEGHEACALTPVRGGAAPVPWTRDEADEDPLVFWESDGAVAFGYVLEPDKVGSVPCASAPATAFAELTDCCGIQGYWRTSPPMPKVFLGPARATWALPPAVSAQLVDSQGRGWPPGFVPAGTYTLTVDGRAPVEVDLEEGANYEASVIGRMFEARPVGAANVCRLAEAARSGDRTPFLSAGPRGTEANGRVADYHGAVVVGDGQHTVIRGPGTLLDVGECFDPSTPPPLLFLLERGLRPALVLALERGEVGAHDRVVLYTVDWTRAGVSQ